MQRHTGPGGMEMPGDLAPTRRAAPVTTTGAMGGVFITQGRNSAAGGNDTVPGACRGKGRGQVDYLRACRDQFPMNLPQPSPEALEQSGHLDTRLRTLIKAGAAGSPLPHGRSPYTPGLGYYSGGARKFGARRRLHHGPRADPCLRGSGHPGATDHGSVATPCDRSRCRHRPAGCRSPLSWNVATLSRKATPFSKYRANCASANSTPWPARRPI